MDTSPLPPGVDLLVALALVLLNGYFVAAEFALVKVRASRLADLAERRRPFAATAVALAGRLGHSLAGAQLGITLTSLALGWLGEPAFARLLAGPLASIGIGGAVLHPLAFGLAFGTITLIHITVGEQVPKLLAIARPEAFALAIAPGMRAFLVVTRPAVALINLVSNGIVRLFGVHAADLSEERVHTETELQFLLAASEHSGVLDAVEQDLASNSLGLGDLTLAAIMIPRVAIVGIADDLSLARARAVAVESRHDWLPVFRGGSADDISSVIDWHSLFLAADGSDWLALAKPVQLLPASVSATFALARLRLAGNEMAVVLDEYGGTAGLVTVRTLYDVVTREVISIDGPAEISGRLPIRVVEDLIGAELADEDTATLGGLVTARLGRFARPGDTVALGAWTVTVIKVAPRRGTVEMLRLERTA